MENWEQKWWRLNAVEDANQIQDLKKRLEFIRNKSKDFHNNFRSEDAFRLGLEINDQLNALQSDLDSFNKTLEHQELINLLKQSFNDDNSKKSNNQATQENPVNKTNLNATKKDTINMILEPLRNAFDTTTHIDAITDAILKYSDDATLPDKVSSKVIQIGNNKFYPPFKILKKESGLTYKAIATVLVYFICKPNGTNIEISTIEKNIKLNYPKL